MRALAILTTALLVAGPAIAGQAVTLKADTANADGLVTLGDLFDGVGAAASVRVAAREGATVALDAAAVQRIAHRAGLDWANAEGLRTIVVHAGVVHAGVVRAGSAFAAAAPRGNVEVLTYTRSLSAGEIVQPSDVVWAKAAAAAIDAPSDAEAVIGQVAKRPLREGALVQARDLGAAQVIKAGDVVIVSYAAGGVSLALEGKAMGPAGVGETLAVQNTVSKRVVQTLVTGPGQAVVGPQAEELKTARSLRYAVR